MYTLKKSLGQHFLRDEGVCRRILDELKRHDFVRLLEVGPGGGALTRHLKDLPGVEFKAVEVDSEKVAHLLSTWPDLDGRIIEASVLDIGPPFEGDFAIIGNFPYNISSQILFRVLDWRDRVDLVVGMFQKEVAVRIASGPGTKDYGILSVLLQAYYRVTYLFDVDPRCFTPPPKVTSGVLRFERIGNPFGIRDHALFLRLVKAAFGQRRKQLRNALKPHFTPEVLAMDVFTRRAEQLGVKEFAELIPLMACNAK